MLGEILTRSSGPFSSILSIWDLTRISHGESSGRLELLQNRVDLYLALGGDFDHALVQK